MKETKSVRNKQNACDEGNEKERRTTKYIIHKTKGGKLDDGDGVVPLIIGGVFQFLLDRRERGQRMRTARCACESSPCAHPLRLADTEMRSRRM